MGIAERRERQKLEVRENILNAAWTIVNTDGWQTLSIRKIADAIEYSVPVIYDYFESKEYILAEFTKTGYRLLSEQLQSDKDKHTSPSAQMEAIALSYWNFAKKQKLYYQLMFGLGMPGCECIKSTAELMSFTQVIKSTIESVAEKAGNKKINSILKLHTFWCTIHGLICVSNITPSSSRSGMSQDKLDKIVLTDFIKGFIKSLEEE